MARFIVIASIAANPVTYLYSDAEKALAKVRTLQRLSTAFELRDGATDAPMTVTELEARLR